MYATKRQALVLITAAALLALAVCAHAGWPFDSCSRSGSAGAWTYYTGQAYCGHFHLGWGSSGTDRIRWYTGGCIAGRDMFMTYRHGWTRRGNGDTSADHWANVEGGYSGDVAANQAGSGNAEHTIGAFASYNWDDWLEIGSDGGGGMDTIANMGRFYPELDAVYAGKSVESYMYAGNVYQWRYLMTNPSQAYWAWGNECRFAHTGGVTSGPGWFNGDRVINGPGTGPGGTMDLYFNMRPTTTGDYNEDFQMVDEWTSWFGDKVSSNGNMRTWTRLSRKEPGSLDGWDNGGRKKGETVRFSVAGADSWGTGNSYSWDWDASTAQGWYAGNACTFSLEDANNRVAIGITGGDPYCYSSGGLAINADHCKYLTIRMWSNGGTDAQLFWHSSAGGWSGDRHVDWPVIADSQWHVYRVPLPASWSGTVYQVRLDPVGTGAANGQTVYVDWLRIHHVNEGLSGLVWLATSQSSWDIHSAAAMTWDGSSNSWYKDYTIAHGYPQTYYSCLRVQNNAAQQSDNHDRRFGGSGGDWGLRSYKVLNTDPTASNASYAGNPWIGDDTPDLEWTYSDADPNAQSNYRVQIDDDSGFGSPALDTQFVAGSSASHTVGSSLGDGQWYYRVAVLDGIAQAARNGSYTGGVTLGQSGAVTGDTSASFDGADDHVVVPAFQDSFGSGMTVEFWAYPTASNAWARFMDFGNGPANDNILVARPGTSSDLSFEVYNGAATGGSARAPGALINNEWHHYACVLNSNGTVAMYRDGTALSVTGRTVMPNPVNRTINYIGRSNWAGDSYYAGRMDEFAIYDRPLTQAEIQAHYAARTSSTGYRDHVLAHSPWAYWRFGESSGSTAENINGGLGWSAGTGFRVDALAPTNPNSFIEANGAQSGVWQNSVASPTFNWSGATDGAGSGVKDYNIYFGGDSGGTTADFQVGASYSPGAQPSGTYYLRLNTRDNVNRQASWLQGFVFKYDGDKPSNPSTAACSDGLASGAWRNEISPTFMLAGDAADQVNLSGLRDAGTGGRYRYYFGTASDGVPAITTDSLQVSPSVAEDGTYYLRVQTQDNAGNWSDASTVFTYKYDGTAPGAAEAYSTSASAGGITVNFGSGDEAPSDKASGLHSSAPYKVVRTGQFESAWISTGTATDPASDLANGDAATYTVKTRDNAGNESTGAISGRKLINGINPWIYTTGATTLAPPGVLPIAPSTVYTGSGDTRVHGFSAGDAKLLWTPVTTGAAVQARTPIAYFDGSWCVLAGSLDSCVYKINPTTGFSDWSVSLGVGNMVLGKIAGQAGVVTSGGTKNLIFAGTYNTSTQTGNFLRALDASSGGTVWTFSPGNLDVIPGSPAVHPASNTLYFTSMSANGVQPSVWAVDSRDGTLKWSASIGDVSGSCALNSAGNTLYVGNSAGVLRAYNAADGTLKWSRTLDSGYAIYGAPWAYGGKLYVASNGGKVWCVIDNGATSSLNAAWGSGAGYTPVAGPSQPCLWETAGKLYVGSSDGKLYQLNMSDGAKDPSGGYALGFTVGDPALDVTRSWLYVGANDGRVYAVSIPF